jgi:DNA-binding NarL/FixJ family response regulator
VQGVGSNEPNLPSKHNDLTPRQSAVLSRVIEGKSNKAIAIELGLTEATVKAHVTAVFKALRVSNRMQAAIAAGKFTALNT